MNNTEALNDRQRVRRRTNDSNRHAVRASNVDSEPTNIPGQGAQYDETGAENNFATDPATSHHGNAREFPTLTSPKSSMGGAKTANDVETGKPSVSMDGGLSLAGDQINGSKVQVGTPKSRKASRRATGSNLQMDEWMDQLLEQNGVVYDHEDSTFAEGLEKPPTTPKTLKGNSKSATGGTPELDNWMDDILERTGVQINHSSTFEEDLLSSRRSASKSTKGTTKMEEWMKELLARNGVLDELESEISSAPETHTTDSISTHADGKKTPMDDWMADFLNRNGVDEVGHFGNRRSKSGKECGKRHKKSQSTCEPSSVTLTPSPSPIYVSGKAGKGNKGLKTSKRPSSKGGSSLSPTPPFSSQSPSPTLESQSPSPRPQGVPSSKLKGSKKGKKGSSSSAPTLASQSPSPSPQGDPSSKGKGKGNKQGKKGGSSKFSSAKATPIPTIITSISPSSTEHPSASPSTGSSARPSKPAPTTAPSALPSETLPTVPPVTRAPTTGTVVLNNFCSTYESVLDTPTQGEFTDSASLTCDHIVQVLTDTLEMAAPGVLALESVSCAPVSTAANPVKICFEVATIFSVDSSVVLTPEEIGELICIAISEPAVDSLLAELAQLPSENPFSSTSGLTCDADAVPSGAPTRSPVAGSTAPISTRRYEITQELLMPTQDQPVFESAAARWESVIIGDVEDYDSSRLPEPPLPGCTYPAVIDDLYICGVIEPIDGPGNLVGTGRANFLRDGSNLPVAGEMVFDADDLDLIRDLGLLEDLVLHEMGKCDFLSP